MYAQTNENKYDTNQNHQSYRKSQYYETLVADKKYNIIGCKDYFPIRILEQKIFTIFQTTPTRYKNLVNDNFKVRIKFYRMKQAFYVALILILQPFHLLKFIECIVYKLKDTNYILQIMDHITKKFINHPKDSVKNCIESTARLNPNIGILQNTQVVALKNLESKVHLIGGGGSGHQPADAGYLYKNGLSAAVCGGVFASPSSQQVLSAIQYVNKNQGVLLIIKNYTGDIINFEIAKQTAELKNICVESITVRDDIAFIEDDPKRQNARGLGGLILVYQILGNAAHEGKSLKQLVSFGHSINSRLFSLNIALGGCSLPGNPPGFSIDHKSFEFGLGVHGQKGKDTLEMKTIDEIIDFLRCKFEKVLNSKNIVILLNNLGGVSEMQMSIILGSILKSFSGYNIVRLIQGRVFTSFEMHGFCLSILQQPSAEELKFLDVFNPHWKIYSQFNSQTTISFEKDHVKCIDQNKTYQLTQISKNIKSVVSHILSKCQYLDSVDRQVGDGDTGTSISRALQFIQENNIIQKLDWKNHLNTSLKEIGRLIATKSAGTLGSILGAFVMSLSLQLKASDQQNSYEDWKRGLEKGLSTIKIVGKCQVGERTILDVLVPIFNKLNDIQQWRIDQIGCQVQKACELVKNMKATKGRSRYLGGKEVGHHDSGCELVRLVIQGLKKN